MIGWKQLIQIFFHLVLASQFNWQDLTMQMLLNILSVPSNNFYLLFDKSVFDLKLNLTKEQKNKNGCLQLKRMTTKCVLT
jgi:hypothetical protein